MVVLFVFLGLSVLISALLARATERAEAAEARERELRTLQALSAELLRVVPGPRRTGRPGRLVTGCSASGRALFVQDPVTRELRERPTSGRARRALARSGTPPRTSPPERLPLSVGGRNLGLLVLRGDRTPLTPAESRVLRAFCDQFALVLERDRLLQVATEAEVYRQSDQVRRSLLAAVSHDLRTPLAAIKTSVTDLLTRTRPATAHTCARRFEASTGDRPAGGAHRQPPRHVPDRGRDLQARVQGVDLAEVITAAWTGRRSSGPSCRSGSTMVPRAPLVRADPVFLDRVVTNLLDNAAKAAHEAPAARRSRSRSRADGNERGASGSIDHGAGVPPPSASSSSIPSTR